MKDFSLLMDLLNVILSLVVIGGNLEVEIDSLCGKRNFLMNR